MKFRFRLSSKASKVVAATSNIAVNECEVLMRFFHGNIDQRAKTNLYVRTDYWREYWNDNKQMFNVPEKEQYRGVLTPAKQIKIDQNAAIIAYLSKCNAQITAIKNIVTTAFSDVRDYKKLPNDWLKTLLCKPIDEPETEPEPENFFDVFNEYIETKKMSDYRRRHMRVVWLDLKRFALFRDIDLTFDNLTGDTLRDFEKFLVDEHKYIDEAQCGKKDFKQYAKVCNQVKDMIQRQRQPKPRGKNTINNLMNRLKSFIIWANERDITSANGFKDYKINECVYGTPYYITIDERNHLYHHNLSDTPQLAVQRDIFVFQCLIGCRVSDLWAMTKDNIIDGAVEYVPRKTKEGRAITVRVPLNTIATEILERYQDYQGKGLFPFTTQQQYNRDIKKMFRLAHLDRMVTVINPTTREEEKRPICDIASSHLARRCFVGNLYKKVKDPNLVGKLSGHKEGSKAFARYRDIDEEMRKELVTMLE